MDRRDKSHSRKNWDAILRDVSSGEDSDAEDSLNLLSVTKNAKRVAELVHGFCPSLDSSKMGAPPKGMNDPALIRDGIVSATQYTPPCTFERDASTRRPRYSTSIKDWDAILRDVSSDEEEEAGKSTMPRK